MKQPASISQVDKTTTIEPGETRLRIALLEGRLEDGYHRIDEAIKAGDDVQAWEDFWITLLEQYEELCDDLAAA